MNICGLNAICFAPAIRSSYVLPAAFSSSSAAHLFLLSASTEPLGQRLFACGRNERGQLGTGAMTAKAAQMPVEIQRFAPAGETIVKVCL